MNLATTARALVRPGHGILAADESLGTIAKRFQSVDLRSTPETRRGYRELLLDTPHLEQFISGVILFEETMRQTTRMGKPLPDVLAERGIMPGIKVDQGTIDMADLPGELAHPRGEKVTRGLDGLDRRLIEGRQRGARFAKWRAVIKIGEQMPRRYCVEINAHLLALYAAASQAQGLVPIVEPEVLMDGDHTLARCEEVTELTLRAVFQELERHEVSLGEVLLKPNMVLPGKECPRQASADEVAEATLRCFTRCVPEGLPGIVFLSGGQTPLQATRNLNAMNVRGPHPWPLSFSYGRALQEPALRSWRGLEARVPIARQQLLHRARCNAAARDGRYRDALEQEAPPDA